MINLLSSSLLKKKYPPVPAIRDAQGKTLGLQYTAAAHAWPG